MSARLLLAISAAAFSACLPLNSSVTPPARFGLYENATVLDPQEYQLSIGHAQTITPTVPAPDEKTLNFLELDTRLRRGFSEKVEGQLSLAALFDQRIGASRAAIKYELPGSEGFRWALEGGAALGYNGSRNFGQSTTRSFFGAADAAILLSGPRYWRFVPYGALGANISGTALLTGLNADGVKDQRPVPFFVPHTTLGVDIGLSNARILLEATPFLAKIPDNPAIPNVVVAASVAFTVGKVRYFSPAEKALPKESNRCVVGKVDVNGVCYTPCGEKMNFCPGQQACVIKNAAPKCLSGIARKGVYVPESQPTSAPTSTSLPASLPDEEKVEEVEPEKVPVKETRDDLTICLAKNDGVKAKERLAICQKYLEAHPNDPSMFSIQNRMIELQKEK
jgi:hypothetical protein